MEITGTSTSRLIELTKYTVTDLLKKKYVTGGTATSDGVDLNNSKLLDKITYYIGGIKYVDFISGNSAGLTYNYYLADGMSDSNNFINVPYFKSNNKEDIYDLPQIKSDVFIIRQELSVFEKNYKLEQINDLTELITYAGGGFFNIVNKS